MTSLVHHITIHCADPYRLAQFWAEVLDGSLAEDVLPGDPKPW
ncbi:VOC family protein [Streptomyces purpurascens]|uniref:Glyoxalase-like domain-containing protein n=1 Tax=Streptomyces purpurascens TaxID=1924 RepID=A0ABZ1MEV7_STREF|nr:VOC family protein [Streptomyces purpurascens]